jgi:hypothetical protein
MIKSSAAYFNNKPDEPVVYKIKGEYWKKQLEN